MALFGNYSYGGRGINHIIYDCIDLVVTIKTIILRFKV